MNYINHVARDTIQIAVSLTAHSIKSNLYANRLAKSSLS